MAYGMQGYLGLAKETVWGTPVTPTAFAKFMSETLTGTIDRFETDNAYGGFFAPDDQAGVNRYAGDIALAANAETAGLLLHAGFGAVTTTTVLTTFKSHVFQAAVADVSSLNPLPAYTLEVFRDVTSAQQYAGCVMSQMQIQGQINQDVRFTTSWLAKNVLNKARIAAASVTYPTSPVSPFTFDTASLSLFPVGSTAAAVDYIEAFNITINNNLEAIPTLNNTTQVAKIRRANPFDVTFSATVGFDDITEYNRFLNQTEMAFKINVTRANSFSMLIDIPRAIYTAFPLSIPGRGRLTVGLESKARTPVGSAGPLAVTLRNNTGAY